MQTKGLPPSTQHFCCRMAFAKYLGNIPRAGSHLPPSYHSQPGLGLEQSDTASLGCLDQELQVRRDSASICVPTADVCGEPRGSALAVRQATSTLQHQERASENWFNSSWQSSV